MICPFSGEECSQPIAMKFSGVINGNKSEFSVCENCSDNVKSLTDEIFKLFAPINFDLQEHNDASNITCKCGMTLYQLTKNGRLGCSECYKTFADFIMPALSKFGKTTKHVGKVPKYLRKEKEIVSLAEEMNAAVVAENYEKAAEIRDKIKKLKDKDGK